eukprot:4670557-Pleurochrysis_carterae.AAC.5
MQHAPPNVQEAVRSCKVETSAADGTACSTVLSHLHSCPSLERMPAKSAVNVSSIRSTTNLPYSVSVIFFSTKSSWTNWRVQRRASSICQTIRKGGALMLWSFGVHAADIANVGRQAREVIDGAWA